MRDLEQQPALVPVEVVADTNDDATVAVRQLRLNTRGGHRIAGLSLADVVGLVGGAGMTRAVSVFAYPRPVDLRKGYDGC